MQQWRKPYTVEKKINVRCTYIQDFFYFIGRQVTQIMHSDRQTKKLEVNEIEKLFPAFVNDLMAAMS